MLPVSNETELGSTKLEASPSVGKNTGVNVDVLFDVLFVDIGYEISTRTYSS